MGLDSTTKIISIINDKKHTYIRNFQKSKLKIRNDFLPFASSSEKQQWGVLYYNVNNSTAEMDQMLKEIEVLRSIPNSGTKLEERCTAFLKYYDQAEDAFNKLDTQVSWLETKYANKIQSNIIQNGKIENGKLLDQTEQNKVDQKIAHTSSLHFLSGIKDPYLMEDYMDDFDFKTGKKPKSKLGSLLEKQTTRQKRLSQRLNLIEQRTVKNPKYLDNHTNKRIYLEIKDKLERTDEKLASLNQRVANLENFKIEFYLKTSQSKSLPKIADLPFPLDLSYPKLKTLHSEITVLELNLTGEDKRKDFLRCIKKEIEFKIEQTKEFQKSADWKQTLSTVSFAVAAVASGALNAISVLAAVPILNTIANPIKQILSFVGYSLWGIATKEDKSLTIAEKEILSEHYSFMRKATMGSAATGFLGAGAVVISIFSAVTLPWSLLVGTALLTISNFAWMATTIKELQHEMDHSKQDAARSARITGHVFNVLYSFTSTIGVALLVIGAVALAFSPPGLIAMAGVLAVTALVTLGVCIASFLVSKASFFVASRQAYAEDSQRLSKATLKSNRLQNRPEFAYEHSLGVGVHADRALTTSIATTSERSPSINKPTISAEEIVKPKKKALRSFNNFSPLHAVSKESSKCIATSSQLSFEEYQKICKRLKDNIKDQSNQIDSPYYQCKVLKEPNLDNKQAGIVQAGITVAIPNAKAGSDILITNWIPEIKPKLQILLSKNSDDRAIFFMMENFSSALPLQLEAVNDPKIVLKLLEAAKTSGWDIQKDPAKSMLQIDVKDHLAIMQDPSLAKEYSAILNLDVDELKNRHKNGKKLGEVLMDKEDVPVLKPE